MSIPRFRQAFLKVNSLLADSFILRLELYNINVGAMIMLLI